MTHRNGEETGMTRKMHRSPKAQWVTIRQRDDELYERHAKHLEGVRDGEFVAIGLDGEVMVDKDRVALLQAAIKRFGSGNFALRKIGADYVLK